MSPGNIRKIRVAMLKIASRLDNHGELDTLLWNAQHLSTFVDNGIVPGVWPRLPATEGKPAGAGAVLDSGSETASGTAPHTPATD